MTFPERWIKEFNKKDDPFFTKVHVIKSLTYRQAISWDGFFSWKHTRNQKEGLDHFFCDYPNSTYKIEFYMREGLQSRGIYSKWEWIEHEDLYAFYDHIGYNRKTKKFER